MPDVLVRHLEPETVERLRASARRHGRTLQAEAARHIREGIERDERAAADASFWEWATEFRRSLEGHAFSDSTESIRTARDSDRSSTW